MTPDTLQTEIDALRAMGARARAYEPPPMYYFAFGMNLIQSTMWDSVHVPGPAWLDGYQMDMAHFATIREHEGATVPGGLWKITPQILGNLDGREGYPRYYGRKEVAVRTDNGTIMAIAYFMNDEHVQLAQPHAGYTQMIEDGYELFGHGDEAYALLLAALERADAAKEEAA